MKTQDASLPLHRRTFLKCAGAAVLAAAGPYGLRGATSAAALFPTETIKGLRARVVRVHDPAMVDDRGEVQAAVIRAWLTRALEQLTGQHGAAAWQALFRPSDQVAIKVNTLGGPRIATHPHVAEAVARGLQEAGVPSRQILVWDRSSRELSRGGYGIRIKGDGPFCFGTDELGYEAQPRIHGSIGSCFSPILTRWATALIDVPVLKDHDLSGVSLSMKNLFGVIHNPNKYHDSGCSPYLADLLGCPMVQEKLRLIVCDAHRGQCHGGPAFVSRWAWPCRELLIGADPVALDRVGHHMIEDRRHHVGLPSLQEEGRAPVHIQAAYMLGLGEGRIEAIQIHEIGV
jgi:uncharacterized protein (DUF362 family)